jgi:hypothetical protein
MRYEITIQRGSSGANYIAIEFYPLSRSGDTTYTVFVTKTRYGFGDWHVAAVNWPAAAHNAADAMQILSTLKLATALAMGLDMALGANPDRKLTKAYIKEQLKAMQSLDKLVNPK